MLAEETHSKPDLAKWRMIYTLSERFKKPVETVASVYEATKHASAYHRIPQTLLIAVAAVESGFNPSAKSSSGAEGVMQTLKSSGVHPLEPQDIEQSVIAGAQLLAGYVKRFGDTEKALVAYNVGPTAVVKGKNKAAGKRYLRKVNRELTYLAGL